MDAHPHGICQSKQRGSPSAATSLPCSFFLADPAVMVPTVTPAGEVGPGLQDLQTRARRILAARNAKKAKENTWIGRMIVAENINDLEALIKSRGLTN